MGAYPNRVVRGCCHRGEDRIPELWMPLLIPPDYFPFLRMANVFATLQLRRLNHTYLGKVFHNLKQTSGCFRDGMSERMINTLEH